MNDAFKLPASIAEISTARFDKLVSEGQIFYGPSVSERVEHNGFELEFRLVPAFCKKPIQPLHDAGRSRAIGPFINPPKEFVIAAVGPSHTLELNKFCVHRPSFILHTNEYAPQSDDLDFADVSAVWTALMAFKTPQIVIYNCGYEAGSSQGHKHVQMFARPPLEDLTLFPDKAGVLHETPVSLPGIPYKHLLIGLPRESAAVDVFWRYKRLLANIRKWQEVANCKAYNIVLTVDWIVLMPRSHHGKEGISGNAATMMGMIWISSKEQREGWSRLGMSDHLAYLGIPTVSSKPQM